MPDECLDEVEVKAELEPSCGLSELIMDPPLLSGFELFDCLVDIVLICGFDPDVCLVGILESTIIDEPVELPTDSDIDSECEIVVDSRSDETPNEFLYVSPPKEAANDSFLNDDPYGLAIDELNNVFVFGAFLNSFVKDLLLLSLQFFEFVTISYN